MPIIIKVITRLAAYLRRGYLIMRDPSHVNLDGIVVPLKTIPEIYQVRRSIYSGSYERPERLSLRALLRSDDVVLEIGAGCGVVTAFVSLQITDSRNVHSYEANPSLIKSISAIAQANDISPNIHNAAVGLEDGEMEFFVADNFFSSSSVDRGIRSRKYLVRCIGFSGLLTKLMPAVVVCDIEGGETMFEAVDLPASVRVVSCELHPHIIGDESVSRVMSRILAQGFSIKLDYCSERVVLFERVGH